MANDALEVVINTELGVINTVLNYSSWSIGHGDHPLPSSLSLKVVVRNEILQNPKGIDSIPSRFDGVKLLNIYITIFIYKQNMASSPPFAPLTITNCSSCVCPPLSFGISRLIGPSLASSSSTSISSSLPSSSPSTSSSSLHFCSSSDSCDFSGVNRLYNRKRFSIYAMTTTLCDFSTPKTIIRGDNRPDHLLVLVHGIFASSSDWTYFEAELKRRLGRSFFIYASSSNAYTKTFDGIDGAGRRLAEEVSQVVQKTESLKKISFLSHSLGGLFARHAITVLYSARNLNNYEPNDSPKTDCFTGNGTIAGLEPINFITLATPHLGVRGRNQLPFLFGVTFLEKIAAPLAPLFAGRTGSQLFLTDGKANRPPLLLRMTCDCDDGKFISALGSFRSRILYANVSFDRILCNIFSDLCGAFFHHSLDRKFPQPCPDMVGWRTSSIRRENQLPKPSRQSLDGYKHVVDVEYCPPVSSQGPHFSLKAVKAKEAAQSAPSTQNTVEYHEIMEEEMICGLQRLGWKKVDVSFHSAVWPFFAHNNIHVKNEWFHNAGAGVVAHVADSIKQQESSLFVPASL
ncbi:hypothetical protein Dimus_032662 [Dionaea muscipula]